MRKNIIFKDCAKGFAGLAFEKSGESVQPLWYREFLGSPGLSRCTGNSKTVSDAQILFRYIGGKTFYGGAAGVEAEENPTGDKTAKGILEGIGKISKNSH